jgi:hypothetical protein
MPGEINRREESEVFAEEAESDLIQHWITAIRY